MSNENRNEDKLILFDWGGIVDSIDYDNKYCYTRLYCDALRFSFDLPDDYTDKMLWEYLNSHEYYMTSHDAPNEVIFDTMCRDIFSELQTADLHTAIELYKEYTLSHQYKVAHWRDIIGLEYDALNQCKCGIMSDLSWLDGHRIAYQIGLDKFDYVFLSYAVGCTKRAGDLFAHVNREIGRGKLDVLLIDDMSENLEKAEQLGWSVYLAKEHDYKGIKSVINQFLNSPRIQQEYSA